MKKEERRRNRKKRGNEENKKKIEKENKIECKSIRRREKNKNKI